MTSPRLTHAAGQTRTEEHAREERRNRNIAYMRVKAESERISRDRIDAAEAALRTTFSFRDAVMGEGK